MAQTSSLSIGAGLSGLAFRNANNTNLAALFSGNSGPTAPSPTVGGMVWLDNGVSPPMLRVRNNANSGWLDVLPETLAASSFWGNPGGFADKLQPVSADQARAILGFPKFGAGLGEWRLVYAVNNTTLFAPPGGTWAYHNIKRSTASGGINSVDVGLVAGGGTISAGASGQDMFGLFWRVA
jgi:hypothetical protein